MRMLTGIEDIQTFVTEAADPIQPRRVAEVRTYLEKSLALSSDDDERAMTEKCIEFVSRVDVSLVDLLIVSYIVNDGIMMRELGTGDDLMGISIQQANDDGDCDNDDDDDDDSSSATDSSVEKTEEDKEGESSHAKCRPVAAAAALPPPDEIANPFLASISISEPVETSAKVSDPSTLEEDMSDMEKFMHSLGIESEETKANTNSNVI